MSNRSGGQREVTYHAADPGASCVLGCLASLGFALAIGMGLWFMLGGMQAWKVVVGVLGLGAGFGLAAFLRSPRRNSWEVTFDREERVIRFRARVGGEVTTGEISYDEVESIGLTPIQRETSEGEAVTFQLPVIYRKGGRDARAGASRYASPAICPFGTPSARRKCLRR